MAKQIIVIACHFESNNYLCKTVVARLKKAIQISSGNDHFLVTGDVPYKSGGSTLAEIMRNWLIHHGVAKSNIAILHGGVGTFSEARLACESVKKDEEVVVVSSAWYFFQGRIIWRRRAKENHLNLSCETIENTAGWKTFLTYAILGLVVHISIFLGLESVLENKLTASQQSRKQGFKLNGCA